MKSKSLLFTRNVLNSRCLVIAIICGICLPLQAQEKARNVQFRTYSVSGDIKGLECVVKGGSIAIEVPGNKRSKVLQYRGASTMVFFRKRDQVEGKPIVPLASVKLAEGMRNPLLVFMRQKARDGGKPSYRIKVIKDDPRDFPNGAMKFMNLTQKRLYLIVGQKDDLKRAVKSGDIVDYSLPIGFKGNVPIKIAVNTPKGIVPVMNSRVFPNKNVRDLYFIWPLNDKKVGNKVRVATLRERGDMAKARLNP